MSNLKLSKFFVSSIIFFSMSAHAQNENISSEYFTLEGTEKLSIPKNKSLTENNLLSDDSDSLKKEMKTENREIQFLKIKLTQKMIDKIAQANAETKLKGGELDYSSGITPFKLSPGAVDIGMANVPVLDQGADGTCVTFASTAALNARFNLGDYIDQQCALSLNLALGKNYWHGASTANEIILPLKKYGFIAKNQCFGYKYPNKKQVVNLDDYYSNSNKNYSNSIKTVNTRADLNSIINAVNSGYRVAIGFTFSDDFGARIKNGDGSHDTYNSNGLWACQQPISSENRCKPQKYGHEVIVIGYDNNQQLLKIRNSWGQSNGDRGDYYMTYSYFNAMALDQTIIQ